MPKVMLIEDDPTMLSLLQILLEMEGFQVVPIYGSADMNDLLGKIVEADPDLLLMDVHLQQTNGLDLIREIRVTPQIQSKIVLMSSGMELGEKCRQAGADGFILKPYMPDDLLQYIRRALSSSSAR